MRALPYRPWLLAAACAAGLAHGAEPAAPAQPLPHSPLMWELKEVQHPRMGAITLAVPAASIVTPVGKEKIDSLVFFSCEKSRGRVAIELANAAESDPKGGLMPYAMPRMVCNLRAGPVAAREFQASWYVSELGDALARGLAPVELRRCASIEITQELALPRGWARERERIDIEIIPYKKELDAVLNECERPQAPRTAQPEAPKPQPAPVSRATVAAEAPWRPARTLPRGRTNLRASPGIDSPVVAQLEAGEKLLVQKTASEWWKAVPRTGSRYQGYVRQDRLVFE